MKTRHLVGGMTAAAFAVLVVAFGAAQFWAPTWEPETSPSEEWEYVLGEQDDTKAGGRRSEHFQIVDDTVTGDVSTVDDDEGVTRGVTDTFVETNAFVTDVIDGDTIDVAFDDGTRARIRMLGVNTPETVDPRRPVECFGKEASDFTKSVLTDVRVRLEEDPQADERDIYGRLLRNVITENGLDVNAALVGEGFAYAYLSFPLDPIRKKQLSDLQAQAEAEERGLWGAGCANT